MVTVTTSVLSDPLLFSTTTFQSPATVEKGMSRVPVITPVSVFTPVSEI